MNTYFGRKPTNIKDKKPYLKADKSDKTMNSQEFKDIIDGVKDKMFRLALRIVRTETEAEDIVQEVIIKVWEKKEHFSTIENQHGWLMTLTRNLSIDKTRSKHKRTNNIDDYTNMSSSSASPDRILEANDLLKKVKELFNQLPEIQRTVLHLRDIEQYSYDEISDITGYTNNQVKINIYRGRQALKEQLEVLKNA